MIQCVYQDLFEVCGNTAPRRRKGWVLIPKSIAAQKQWYCPAHAWVTEEGTEDE